MLRSFTTLQQKTHTCWEQNPARENRSRLQIRMDLRNSNKGVCNEFTPRQNTKDITFLVMAIQSAHAKLRWGELDPKAKDVEEEVRRRFRENRDEVVAEVCRKYGLKDD
jgi:hypothetical protein